MPFTVTMNLRGSERVLVTIDNMEKRTVKSLLSGIGLLAARSVQRGIQDQRSPDGTPYPPVDRYGEGGQRLRDRGILYNSIHSEVVGDSVLVGTNVDYAPAQNFGGTWGPKNAKLMAIPLTRQIARAYVAGRSLRDQYPEAFIFTSGSGLFLVRKDPKATKNSKRQLEFLFKLVPSVTVPGMHFLDSLSAEGETDILTYAETVVQRQAAGEAST